jgi:hypothetical protein
MKARSIFPVFLFLVVASLLITPVAAQETIFQLSPGFTIRQAVDAEQQSQQYHIAGMMDASVFVLLTSQDYTNAPAVTLTNDANNMAIAEMRLAVSAMCLRLAPGSNTYTLSVSADHPQSPQNYALLLLQGDPDAMMCSGEMLESLALGAGGAGAGTVIRIGSQVGGGTGNGGGNGSGGDGGSGAGGNGNCVATSDTLIKVSDANATPIGAIDMGDSVPVLGAISGNDWLIVNSDGIAGLAPRDGVSLEGDCSNVSAFVLDGDQALDLGQTFGLSAFRLGRMVDLDGDGILDIDSNGDGLLDLDLDRDGLLDTDLDRDGLLDTDLNGDGLLDVDSNGDGIIDVDLNGDGVLDANGLRIDGDLDDSGLNANVDTSNGSFLSANVDTNGDGILDVDLNGDGVIDDVNADGLVDVDLNGDGILDIDTNGDGIIDTDLNGDGILDIDTNGDGIIDVDANTNNGLNASVDTNTQGNTGVGGVDVNLNTQNNSAPDLSVDLNTADDTGADVSVDLQGGAAGSTGLCVNALGVEIAC